MPSLWSEETLPESVALQGDRKTDILVIGGGLAGVLTAYLLTQGGADCLLVEGGRIASGVTENTTAKITAQHGVVYQSLIKRFGLQRARQYYDINIRALEQYRHLFAEIPCDLEEKTAYVYSWETAEKLEPEADAYQKLDIPFIWKEAPSGLPFPVAAALGLTGQYQFHPRKLIKGLLPQIKYHENTFIRDIKGHRAISDKGTITANRIILATHYPLVNIPGLYFMKLKQHRSYVAALENGPDLDGMYIDADEKGYSFRNYGKYLLLGGAGHPTGKNSGGCAQLRAFAQTYYAQNPVRYTWATQDCMTLDGVPYVGVHRRGAGHVYVSTGFNKWGMTGAMAGALVLRDLLFTGSSEYKKLFSPGRSMLHPALFGNLASSVAGLARPGKRCPHMGCGLIWNDREKSWDCPCHGSRFAIDGSVIDNPAKRGMHIE